MAAGQCRASVEVRPAARYPYVPACSCGWTTWGYVAQHAAQGLADAHMAGQV